MHTIYKYPIAVEDEFITTMPEGARILGVQVQAGTPVLWALVDPEAWTVERRFALRGTGHPADGLEQAVYVGTFQMHGGSLVFHLFDRGEP